MFEQFKNNHIVQLKVPNTTTTKNIESPKESCHDEIYTKCMNGNKKEETNIVIHNDIKPIITLIPSHFMPTSIVFDMIPAQIKKLLNLTNKNKLITYRDFRSLLINYLNTNELIKDSKITLIDPFLYRGNNIVDLRELNEWAYSLLTKHKTDVIISNKITKSTKNK